MKHDGNGKLTLWAVLLGLGLAIFCLILGNVVWAENLALLQDIEIHPLTGNKSQLEFMFNGPAVKPTMFAMDDPKSLIIDFPSIGSRLPKEFKEKSFNVGAVDSLKVIEAPHKTRIVLALKEKVAFNSEVQGNKNLVLIEPNKKGGMEKTAQAPVLTQTVQPAPRKHLVHPVQPAQAAQAVQAVQAVQTLQPGQTTLTRIEKTPIKNLMNNTKAQNVFVDDSGNCYEIVSFDFQKGENGEARLIFQLSSPSINVDFKQENNKIIAHFMNACIPERFVRRFDVRDFGTPLQEFTIMPRNNVVNVNMLAAGNYEKIAYQTDNKFIIEFRKVNPNEAGLSGAAHYTGEKLSFNFQNIEIRAALQILADFAGFNLIACDSIAGNITLRLQDVPWDQALDIIMKCKKLGKRQFGQVMMVGPADELLESERSELESLQQVDNLQPLLSEQIQINYAKAKDISVILKEKGNNFMSSRGNVSYDERTNILLIQDTPTRLAEIRGLLQKLDVPVSQVEISSQIVSANDNFEDLLGVKLGGGMDLRLGKKRLGVGSSNERARSIASNAAGVVPPPTPQIPFGPITNSEAGSPFPFPQVATTEGLFTDLPVAPTVAGLNPGSVALALARLPNNMLIDLELQALEFENKIKTISRPKITTTNKTKAYVEQGFEIPFQEASSSGATSVSFKKAVLRLEVTPQITPDGKIIMDLIINNDTLDNVNTVTQQGTQSSTIQTNHLETQVLVDNGETIVLGGVLTLTETKTRAKIPFFGDLPFVGIMFRNRFIEEQRKEILIFITPRIVKPNEC